MPESDAPELTVADVIRHYFPDWQVPEGHVGWRKMKCPFHDDKTASAGINEGLNAFNCLACPYAGSPISLIMRKESIGREEAIEFARSVLGTSVTRVQRSVSKSSQRRPLGRERWKDILG